MMYQLTSSVKVGMVVQMKKTNKFHVFVGTVLAATVISLVVGVGILLLGFLMRGIIEVWGGLF